MDRWCFRDQVVAFVRHGFSKVSNPIYAKRKYTEENVYPIDFRIRKDYIWNHNTSNYHFHQILVSGVISFLHHITDLL